MRGMELKEGEYRLVFHDSNASSEAEHFMRETLHQSAKSHEHGFTQVCIHSIVVPGILRRISMMR